MELSSLLWSKLSLSWPWAAALVLESFSPHISQEAPARKWKEWEIQGLEPERRSRKEREQMPLMYVCWLFSAVPC